MENLKKWFVNICNICNPLKYIRCYRGFLIKPSLAQMLTFYVLEIFFILDITSKPSMAFDLFLHNLFDCRVEVPKTTLKSSSVLQSNLMTLSSAFHSTGPNPCHLAHWHLCNNRIQFMLGTYLYMYCSIHWSLKKSFSSCQTTPWHLQRNRDQLCWIFSVQESHSKKFLYTATDLWWLCFS